MSEELKQAAGATKQVAEAIIQSPKTAFLSAGFTATIHRWLESFAPMVSFTAQIAGLILVIILARYHWVNTQLKKKELDETNRRYKELQDIEGKQ